MKILECAQTTLCQGLLLNFLMTVVQTGFPLYIWGIRHMLIEQREENRKLFVTANELKQDIQFYSLNEPFFKDNDERVLFNTGLSTLVYTSSLTLSSIQYSLHFNNWLPLLKAKVEF